MPSIRVGGLNIFYELHGDGKPVVLIAGLGTGMGLFASTIKALSQRFRILAFDNRGVGRTDKPDIKYSIEMMAEDTAGLMTALDFSPAGVVGVSMGGKIAIALALMHPEMVRSLVLVSTSARVREASPKSLQFRFGNLVNRVTGSGPLGKYAQPYYAFKRQNSASSGYDCTSRLGEIRAPTLILNGAKDKLATPELAKEMNVGVGGSELQTFKGGHMFFVFDNKGFTESVGRFLEKAG